MPILAPIVSSEGPRPVFSTNVTVEGIVKAPYRYEGVCRHRGKWEVGDSERRINFEWVSLWREKDSEPISLPDNKPAIFSLSTQPPDCSLIFLILYCELRECGERALKEGF